MTLNEILIRSWGPCRRPASSYVGWKSSSCGHRVFLMYMGIARGFERTSPTHRFRSSRDFPNTPLFGTRGTRSFCSSCTSTDHLGVIPCLIFSAGAMTDFGPLMPIRRCCSFGAGPSSACSSPSPDDPHGLHHQGGRLRRHHRRRDGPTTIYLTARLARIC